jgi:hypothetical protein
MKASGPKEERETVVVFDEDTNLATLWTASDSIYRQMLKRGWIPTHDEERHAVFEFPKNSFKLPRGKSHARMLAGQRLHKGKTDGNTLNKENGQK